MQIGRGAGNLGKDESMKRSRFSEEQIIGVLKVQRRVSRPKICAASTDQRGGVLQLEEQIRGGTSPRQIG